MRTDQVLVLNCGSSSIKFAVVGATTGEANYSGIIEKIGTTNAALKVKATGHKEQSDLGDIDYTSALDKILSRIKQSAPQLLAVGHRVVHGGEQFKHSVLIDEHVMSAIKSCNDLAPLHNPNNLKGIRAAQQAFPELSQVAVFDTAFHQTMPKHAYLYPIPQEYYEQLHIRRYGFHGTSHRYVSQKAAEILNKPLNECALLTAHLGNGCSASAILNGQSVDTTMGLTPLEGLMMGTRSGDVDPGMHQFLAQQLNIDINQVTDILNKKSGLLGISGLSMDMRDLEIASASGDENAELARHMFCYRAAKSLAALSVNLPHLDALIFTGGIGENDSDARSAIIKQLRILNFILDTEHNKAHGRENNHCITTGKPTALVIPTNEEWIIAQDTSTIAGGVS